MLIDTAMVREIAALLGDLADTSQSLTYARRAHEVRAYLNGLLESGGIVLPDNCPLCGVQLSAHPSGTQCERIPGKF
jgi:hypothetical protein